MTLGVETKGKPNEGFGHELGYVIQGHHATLPQTQQHKAAAQLIYN
jgi:hypothetical protein